MGLFRDEVMGRKNDTLDGVVDLSIPVNWQIISFSLFAMVVIALIFLAVGKLSKTEMATGVLAPAGGVIGVFPARAGRVDKIFVRERQFVIAGTKLLSIKTQEIDSAGQSTSDQILSEIAVQDRNIALQQTASATRGQEEREGRKERISNLLKQLSHLDSEIAAQMRLVDIADNNLSKSVEIAKRGFISRSDIAVREEGVILKRQQLASLQQERIVKQDEIAREKNELAMGFAQAISTAASLDSARAQIAQQRANAQAERGYFLVASRSGEISSISVHQGETVQPQEPAMFIVPGRRGRTLQAEIKIPVRSIGFVKVGQTVRLSVDAFPSERTNTLIAKFVTVSTVPRVEQDESGKRNSYYLGIARIVVSENKHYPYIHQLLPGMSFTATTVTSRLSLLNWLLGDVSHPKGL